MSDTNDNSDDPVGYRKPPKQHQFKKGRSGNPKGRPRKIDRTVLPDQLTRDMLAMANMPVPIKIGGREFEVSTYEAALMKLRALALNGDRPAIRELLRRADNAAAAFAEDNKANMGLYILFDEDVRSTLGSPSKYSVEQLNLMSRAIKKKMKG